MQQKQRRSGYKIVAALIVLVTGGTLFVMSNAKAPQQPIEKELDAKTFLGAKE